MATDSPAELADRIIELGLSVREAETLTRSAGPAPGKKPKPEKPADTKALERSLAEALGLDVLVADKGKAGGSVTITYKTLDQLDELCKRLMQPVDRG